MGVDSLSGKQREKDTYLETLDLIQEIRSLPQETLMIVGTLVWTPVCTEEMCDVSRQVVCTKPFFFFRKTMVKTSRWFHGALKSRYLRCYSAKSVEIKLSLEACDLGHVKPTVLQVTSKGGRAVGEIIFLGERNRCSFVGPTCQ